MPRPYKAFFIPNFLKFDPDYLLRALGLYNSDNPSSHTEQQANTEMVHEDQNATAPEVRDAASQTDSVDKADNAAQTDHGGQVDSPAQTCHLDQVETAVQTEHFDEVETAVQTNHPDQVDSSTQVDSAAQFDSAVQTDHADQVNSTAQTDRTNQVESVTQVDAQPSSPKQQSERFSLSAENDHVMYTTRPSSPSTAVHMTDLPIRERDHILLNNEYLTNVPPPNFVPRATTPSHTDPLTPHTPTAPAAPAAPGLHQPLYTRARISTHPNHEVLLLTPNITYASLQSLLWATFKLPALPTQIRVLWNDAPAFPTMIDTSYTVIAAANMANVLGLMVARGARAGDVLVCEVPITMQVGVVEFPGLGAPGMGAREERGGQLRQFNASATPRGFGMSRPASAGGSKFAGAFGGSKFMGR